MPLTTRCRHCGRLFPVYAQELKVHHGKVGCPQCGGRFDGLSGLLDEAIPGAGITDGGRATGGRRQPAATAPADLLTFDEPPHRRGRATSALWLLGILILTAGLVAQMGWWERGTWLLHPQARTVVADACARVGCGLPLPRVAGTMEILQPTLGEHPLNPAVLRLGLTLINHARLLQRLPLLQLELYDDRGELTAARRLAPEEYANESGPRELGPGTAMNLMLDLVMPTAAPAGFRVRLF